MNFADSKQDNLSKKCLVRAFKVNQDVKKILLKDVNESKNFVSGKIIIISAEKHIKIRDLIKHADRTYVHFSVYNPKEKVSISPAAIADKDLIDVENYDNVHMFLSIKGNNIVAIFQISTNWPENKLKLVFEKFGIQITPTAILRSSIIETIKKEGFKSLHVEVSVHETDFNKKPSFIKSLIKTEPKLKEQGISGHLEINHRGNSALAHSIENNPAKWVEELDNEFYIETKKGTKITGDDLKLTKPYFTVPYGSKTISSKYAKEIIDSFIDNEL
ncbi:hypothetical protein [Yersinia similis]|uniref:hypothetical protein n=1 Tax=Yersinia similis TaxID=367190 RepID=UPI0011A48377|nr:hypothetical protein [Yersinia similis]